MAGPAPVIRDISPNIGVKDERTFSVDVSNWQRFFQTGDSSGIGMFDRAPQGFKVPINWTLIHEQFAKQLSIQAAANVKPLVDRLLKKRAGVVDDEPSELIWGAASNFNFSSATGLSTTPGGSVQISGPDGQQPNPGNANTYTEISKVTQNYRVENPDDSTQYVIVQRRTSSQFRRGDGTVFTFTYDNTGLTGTAV